jgi:hypothetical protein
MLLQFYQLTPAQQAWIKWLQMKPNIDGSEINLCPRKNIIDCPPQLVHNH